jgi:predicted alpha/beta-fold hydrolase
MSSGNGLIGSHATFHDEESPNVKSYLLLLGGADYRKAFVPTRGDWRSRLLFSSVLLPACKHFMLTSHEAVLRPHNPTAYEAASNTTDISEFYNIVTGAFSGYEDEEECNNAVNGFVGGPGRTARNVTKPFLLVYADDDPVEPEGPDQFWIDAFNKGENVASAIFSNGSHLACYESWDLKTRWCDKLVIEWVELMQQQVDNAAAETTPEEGIKAATPGSAL